VNELYLAGERKLAKSIAPPACIMELTVTTRAGRNEYSLPRNMKARWIFPTMSIHGEDNGLADVETLTRIRKVLARHAHGKISTCSCDAAQSSGAAGTALFLAGMAIAAGRRRRASARARRT